MIKREVNASLDAKEAELRAEFERKLEKAKSKMIEQIQNDY